MIDAGTADVGHGGQLRKRCGGILFTQTRRELQIVIKRRESAAFRELSDRDALLISGVDGFIEIGVGKIVLPVDIVADGFEHLLLHQFHCRNGCAGKREKILNALPCFDIDDHIVGAAGKSTLQIMFRKKRSDVFEKDHMGRGQFQMTFLFRGYDAAAGEENTAQKSGEAAVVFHDPRIEAQCDKTGGVIAAFGHDLGNILFIVDQKGTATGIPFSYGKRGSYPEGTLKQRYAAFGKAAVRRNDADLTF